MNALLKANTNHIQNSYRITFRSLPPILHKQAVHIRVVALVIPDHAMVLCWHAILAAGFLAVRAELVLPAHVYCFHGVTTVVVFHPPIPTLPAYLRAVPQVPSFFIG